jgi:hypothetical protein
MTANALGLLGALAALASLAMTIRAIRGRKHTLASSLVNAAVPLLLFLAGTAIYIGVAKGQYSDWDAGRLAVSVAATQGIPVYSTLEEGSIQTTMYPPAWVLNYMPTSLGRTPTEVMVIGYLLAALFTMGPVLLACWLQTRVWPYALLGTCLVLYAATQSLTLEFACYLPHADAPALGFGLLSAIAAKCALSTPDGRRRSIMLGLCAVAMALTVFSKQTLLTLLPAVWLWVGLTSTWSTALRLLIWTGFAGIFGLVLSILCHPLSGLSFQLLTLPAACPWVGGFPFNMIRVLLELLEICVPGLMLIATLFGARWVSTQKEEPLRLGRDLWPLVLLISFALTPMSVLGRVKIGGVESALSPTVYFLYVATALCIVEHAVALKRTLSDDTRSSRLAISVVLLTASFAIPWLLKSMQEIRYGLGSPANNLSQQAYDYLLEHPNENVYFPAYPLAHLMAEGKLYHFMHAIRDREVLAGFKISPEQFATHTPSEPSLVCWSTRLYQTERLPVKHYYAEYSERVKVPGLAKYRCYRIPISTTAP